MKNLPNKIYLQIGEMTVIECHRNEDTKYRNLLVSILSTIADAADETTVDDGLDYGTGYFPHFRFEPTFEFTEEEMTLIKQLEDEECEDWSTITDYKEEG